MDLDPLYRAQLEAQAQDAGRPGLRPAEVVNQWQREGMLAWMKTRAGGRLGAGQTTRTWVWSDLHLDHAEVISVFGRPFRTLGQMQRALIEAWQQTVDEADTMICLGDVTVGPQRAALDEALAALPGTKVLVAGNHDFGQRGLDLKTYGFEAAYPTLVCKTDPPLLLTHEPLEKVPGGCMSVHGHLHGPAARRAARRPSRHLNVNVELTSYRPVRLSELAATAQALLAGEIQPQETTTRTIALARRARRSR